MEKIEDFVKLNKALASFMNDFCLLKEKNDLSQKEVAAYAGTTQSAISRIETMNTNPSYKVLSKLSEAVGGNLYLTPMGDMSITVPFGMQDKIKTIADSKGISVRTLLLQLIKKEISENYTAELDVQSLSDLDFSKYSDFETLPKCDEFLDELCA